MTGPARRSLALWATDSWSTATPPFPSFTWVEQRTVVALSNVQRLANWIGSAAALFQAIVRVDSLHSPRCRLATKPDE